MPRNVYTFEHDPGVPMSQALTPKEQAHMRMFLRALVTFAGRRPGNSGKKIDINSFMREWRKIMSGRVKAGKNRNQWTKEEDRLLLELREEGIDWEEIGKRFGRTVIACRERHNRLRRLGMEAKNKLEGAV